MDPNFVTNVHLFFVAWLNCKPINGLFRENSWCMWWILYVVEICWCVFRQIKSMIFSSGTLLDVKNKVLSQMFKCRWKFDWLQLGSGRTSCKFIGRAAAAVGKNSWKSWTTNIQPITNKSTTQVANSLRAVLSCTFVVLQSLGKVE